MFTFPLSTRSRPTLTLRRPSSTIDTAGSSNPSKRTPSGHRDNLYPIVSVSHVFILFFLPWWWLSWLRRRDTDVVTYSLSLSSCDSIFPTNVHLAPLGRSWHTFFATQNSATHLCHRLQVTLHFLSKEVVYNTPNLRQGRILGRLCPNTEKVYPTLVEEMDLVTLVLSPPVFCLFRYKSYRHDEETVNY